MDILLGISGDGISSGEICDLSGLREQELLHIDDKGLVWLEDVKSKS